VFGLQCAPTVPPAISLFLVPKAGNAAHNCLRPSRTLRHVGVVLHVAAVRPVAGNGSFVGWYKMAVLRHVKPELGKSEALRQVQMADGVL
jgi:hypothetical protein